jgi:hypothetical protein
LAKGLPSRDGLSGNEVFGATTAGELPALAELNADGLSTILGDDIGGAPKAPNLLGVRPCQEELPSSIDGLPIDGLAANGLVLNG